MITVFIWLAIAAALGVYFAILYSGLVVLKHGVGRAWSTIDALLEQRREELPELVAACRQFAQFEREALDRLLAAQADADRARARGDVKGVGAAEAQIRLGLGSLAATVESYPELKARQPIQQLLDRIAGLENALADRRDAYNQAVSLNNVRIAQFPDLIVARVLAFRPAEPLVFGEGGLAAPPVPLRD